MVEYKRTGVDYRPSQTEMSTPHKYWMLELLTLADIGSDHSLVLGNIRIPIQKHTEKKQETREKFNIESFEQYSTRQLGEKSYAK